MGVTWRYGNKQAIIHREPYSKRKGFTLKKLTALALGLLARRARTSDLVLQQYWTFLYLVRRRGFMHATRAQNSVRKAENS